jgi:hypothetical protein
LVRNLVNGGRETRGNLRESGGRFFIVGAVAAFLVFPTFRGDGNVVLGTLGALSAIRGILHSFKAFVLISHIPFIILVSILG